MGCCGMNLRLNVRNSNRGRDGTVHMVNRTLLGKPFGRYDVSLGKTPRLPYFANNQGTHPVYRSTL